METTPKTTKPKWLALFEQISVSIVQTTGEALRAHLNRSADMQSTPELALQHISACLISIDTINRQGMHAVSMSLLRQCVEALVIVDLGLQIGTDADKVLAKWADEKVTNGDVRRFLEQNIWPAYGTGLWQETWAEFYSEMARSVQPYSHYSRELQNWQFAVIPATLELKDPGHGAFFAMSGGGTYDPIKASRITLFMTLVIWALGRLLKANEEGRVGGSLSRQIDELGTALANSKLLFGKNQWSNEFSGLVLFKYGADWIDN